MSKLTVFYNPNQTAKENSSFSPSAGKPAEVLKSWQELGLPLAVKSGFKPLTASQIAIAHDPEYVQGVLDLTQPNGFGNNLAAVRDALPWTTGSFLAAALHAVKTGSNAASLTSGFHHANYASGGGFCTFNGLMIAALHLLAHGYARKVGILDLDAHYGNGTDNIIERLQVQNQVSHWTFGQHVHGKQDSESFLKKLPNIVCNFRDCDVILFQAGADPHVDDPLGGMLTSEQMRKRDEIVFRTAKKIGVPVAWNLAGGYQSPLRKVLDIHDATAIECLKVSKEK